MKLIFGFIFLENHYIHVFTTLRFVQWSVAPNIVCDKFEIFKLDFYASHWGTLMLAIRLLRAPVTYIVPLFDLTATLKL